MKHEDKLISIWEDFVNNKIYQMYQQMKLKASKLMILKLNLDTLKEEKKIILLLWKSHKKKKILQEPM